jgi:hypothetical protein
MPCPASWRVSRQDLGCAQTVDAHIHYTNKINGSRIRIRKAVLPIWM